MGVSELLLQLADPQAIISLSFLEKMSGGLLVAFLGMGITFLALILLQSVIILLAKGLGAPLKTPAIARTVPVVEPEAAQFSSNSEDELIAVISAAVAMKMQRSTGDIVIRTIRKLEEPAPLWNRAGILEQMNIRI